MNFTTRQLWTSVMNALTIAVFALAAVAALAAPAQEATPVPIVKSSNDGPYPDGAYSYSYETGNGISAQEEGQVVKSQDPEKDNVLSVRGSYSYYGEDGAPVQVTYVADENGFQPKGEHLPAAPAIPAAILRALEYIALHPEEDNL